MTTKIATLVDVFSGSNLNLSIWTPLNGLSTQLDRGHAVIPETAGSPTLASTLAYDLVDSQFSAKISTGPGSLTLDLQVDTANRITFAVAAGQLIAGLVVAGVATDVTTPYDQSRDVWWRIRHTGTTLFWETSPGAQVWSVKRQILTPFDLTAMTIQFIGYPDTALSGYGSGSYGGGSYGSLPEGGYGSFRYGLDQPYGG